MINNKVIYLLKISTFAANCLFSNNNKINRFYSIILFDNEQQ